MSAKMIEDKTKFFQRSDAQVRTISVRGWLALGIIGTACFCTIAVTLAAVAVAIYQGSLSVLTNDPVTSMFVGIKELALIALGYYFGKEEAEHFGRRQPKISEVPTPTPATS